MKLDPFATTLRPVISQLPLHWQVSKFGVEFSESGEKNGDSPIGPMLSVSSYRGVEVQRADAAQRPSSDVSLYRVVRPGQLAANMMWLNFGGLGVSSLSGYISPAYKAFWISERMNPRFAHHLLRSRIYVDTFASLGQGVRPNSQMVASSHLSMLPILLPPLSEQHRIADYLDRETAEIDAMDADLDQLVETLRERDAEQHQAAIDTAGHPEVGLALLAEVQLGKMLDQKKVIGEPTEYLRAANITKEGLVSLDDVKVMPMTASERSKLDLRRGDTLMIEGGDAGRVAFLPEGLPGRAFQKTVLRIRPRSPRVEARYLYLALRQAYRSGRIGLDHSVSTIPHFTAEKAERLLVPLPPLEEQRRIVAELDEQTARIDDMIADAERLKGLLAERRSTLITDVVTGKKEVPA